MKRKRFLSRCTPRMLFFTLMSCSLISMLLSLLLTRGATSQTLVWNGPSLGIFPDFYQSVFYLDDPNPIYPAGVYLLMDLFRHCFPYPSRSSWFQISLTPYGMIFGFSIFFLILAAICLFLFRQYRGSFWEKAAFCLLVAFSPPSLYMVERGNLIGVSLLCSLFFLFYYRHGNALVREISLISLALAAMFKVYPALFGVLLLVDKRYAQMLRCLIYGIVAFFVPFLIRQGISGLFSMFKNITSYLTSSDGAAQFAFAYRLDMSNTFGMLGTLFSGPDESWRIAGSIAGYLHAGLAMGSAFFLKERWKMIALIATVIILLQPFSWMYTMLYLLPALLLFLNDSPTPQQKNFLFSLLFALLFMAFPCTPATNVAVLSNPVSGTSLQTVIQSFSLLAFSLLLIWDGLAGLHGKIAAKRRFRQGGLFSTHAKQ